MDASPLRAVAVEGGELRTHDPLGPRCGPGVGWPGSAGEPALRRLAGGALT